ncbi:MULTISPECIES: hypothetical protein [unclassified Sphingopyxis]|jgi:hypothetical protein|nr:MULTISPECIES: hypothetical protein [unclassified Sphingopyxis]
MNSKMLHCYYKNAAANPLVANAGLIHKRTGMIAALCAFSVGGIPRS